MEKSISTISLDQKTEKELIRHILSGEKHLFESLIRKYNRRSFRIASSYLKDPKDAEDVVQNAYIKTFVNLSKFDFNSSYATWFTRILINECLQVLRKNKKRHLVYDEPVINERQDITNPYKEMLNKEFQSVLENLIFTLPEKYRIVYMMREVEQMDTSETAHCLSLTETNVKVRLSRAKDLMKKALSKIYDPKELFCFDGERCDRVTASVLHLIIK